MYSKADIIIAGSGRSAGLICIKAAAQQKVLNIKLIAGPLVHLHLREGLKRPQEKRMTALQRAYLVTIVGLIGAMLSGHVSSSRADTRSVNQYLCKDIVRENGSRRDVAIAFLHGFALGRTQTHEFNIDEMRAQTDAFIEHCLDNPTERAIDVISRSRGK